MLRTTDNGVANDSEILEAIKMNRQKTENKMAAGEQHDYGNGDYYSYPHHRISLEVCRKKMFMCAGVLFLFSMTLIGWLLLELGIVRFGQDKWVSFRELIRIRVSRVESLHPRKSGHFIGYLTTAQSY